jgi:redox-sensitive bicupin YhaK (pirin superfamily)
MIKIRRSLERGAAQHGWLEARHTFSFAQYHDPAQMGFSVLRVINEDKIAGAAGFPPHSHQNMEILTYIIEGALAHRDSMGNTSVIRPGELQRMSAGTGVTHSEYNSLKDQKTHLLQIWIMPDREGYSPSYEQKNFSERLQKNEMTLVASNSGRDGSLKLNQDVDLYALKSSEASERILNLQADRYYWLQVVRGTVQFNEFALSAGDGLSAGVLSRAHFRWTPQSEFLFFDLP